VVLASRRPVGPGLGAACSHTGKGIGNSLPLLQDLLDAFVVLAIVWKLRERFYLLGERLAMGLIVYLAVMFWVVIFESKTKGVAVMQRLTT
jgi:hypothetical protein